jgi:AcrR family transcriptional regulator
VSPAAASGIRSREEILRRAVSLASVEGLEGLTIGRLASDLRMTKSALFARFGSKEELQLATLESANALLWRTVVEPAREAAPGLTRVRALIEGYLQYLEQDTLPGGCFLSAAAAEFDGRPGPVRDAIIHASRAWGKELQQQAEKARAQGELDADTDTTQLVFKLGAFATRANTLYQLHGDRRAFEYARHAITELIG